MNIRSDKHRPSEIVPSDYNYILSFNSPFSFTGPATFKRNNDPSFVYFSRPTKATIVI